MTQTREILGKYLVHKGHSIELTVPQKYYDKMMETYHMMNARTTSVPGTKHRTIYADEEEHLSHDENKDSEGVLDNYSG